MLLYRLYRLLRRGRFLFGSGGGDPHPGWIEPARVLGLLRVGIRIQRDWVLRVAGAVRFQSFHPRSAAAADQHHPVVGVVVGSRALLRLYLVQ